MKDALMNGIELMRVGFVRLNFSYFISDDELNYILDALEFVANFGWMFLPAYKFDIDNGIWVNREE